MNAVQYKAEGISNFNALQVQVHKRLSNGLQFTTSYTWSHSLDEQSGLGLFFTGNNPLTPRANYGSSDFDQTHVFLVNYSYTIPKLVDSRALGYAVNGWTIGGQTVAQSGQPYSVYDYSGSVASQYYGTSNYIGNPIVPLLPGVTAKQAARGGICPMGLWEFRRHFVSSMRLISDPSSWLRGPTGFPLPTVPGKMTMNPCLELQAGTLFEAPSRCAST